MTRDGTDRKSLARLAKQAKQSEANRIAYTRTILSDRFGREWMWNLLTRCHCFHTSFVAGHPDITAFQLGEQSIGLQLLADVTLASPADYTLMSNEALTRELANASRESNPDQQSADPAGNPGSLGNDPGQPIDDGSGFLDPDDPASYH
jgi:hypothetical protein